MNVRPFTEDDAPIVAALISRDEEVFYGRPSQMTAADILRTQHWFTEMSIYEEEGRVIATAAYGMHGDAANVRGIVGEKGRGIGTLIAERGEEFAREHGAAKIHAGFAEPDTAARRLFESRGYREVRRFYEMAIVLQEEPSAPALPDDLVLDEVRDGEERAFYDALNAAFQDHWEWHPMPFEQWIELRRGQHHDEHGPLWFVVRDGNEFAALTRNEVAMGGGYVGAIGVRSAWRGRGLAKVLLARTFAEFRRRGMPRVSLDVDTQNATGATQLYERVGMHVESCGVVLEKS